MPVKVSRAGYLSYYYSRRRKRADTSLDPGLVPEGNWTALSAALLSDQTQGGFRIQTASDDAFGMSQKSRTDFVVGATYRIRATVDIVSSSTTATLRVGTATINNAGSLIDAAKTADGSWELTFVASATTLYFGMAISRAAFSADATVSDFSIDWQPIDLDELSLNDLSATADIEWSATITGKTTGSTVEATASDSTVLTVVDTTVSGTFTVAGAKTVSLEETHPNARAPRTTHIGVTVDVGSETPVIEIDAPTEVTYIAETNPPSFNMVISETGDGAVEVGDEPQKRYDGAGTIYTGDPIDAIPATQPLGGFGDSALPDPSAGYVQFRFRRSDGLGGYVYSEWSSDTEGDYTIGDLVDPVFTSPTTGDVDEGVTLSFNVTTDEATTKTIIGGAQAADFELVSGGTPATTHVLRWASNGTETPGVFEVEIEAEDAAGNTATQTITITCDAVTWSPADEPPGTFSQWLDGHDSGTFTMDGSSVTQWADKSGSGNHATSLTPGPGLASGGGVIFFNEGNNRAFASALSASNDDEAVFAVVKTPSSLASPAAILGASNPNGREFRVNGGELSMVRQDTEEEAISSGLSLPTSTLMLIELQLEFGAQTIMGRDGTLQTSTGLHDTAFTAGRTSYIGAKQPGLEPWGNGELKEKITCPTKPDAILAAKIRTYLNAGWGL